MQAWAGQHAPFQDDGWFHELEEDYTRLFVGPGQVLAPPWESVFVREGRLVFTEDTLEVRSWYRRCGLEPVNLYREPDDHLGLEMAFLAHLANQAAAALAESDLAGYERWLDRQREFCAAHPARWALVFCAQMEEYARTDFFRGLARMSQGALVELFAMLGVEAVRP